MIIKILNNEKFLGWYSTLAVMTCSALIASNSEITKYAFPLFLTCNATLIFLGYRHKMMYQVYREVGLACFNIWAISNWWF